MSPSLRHIPLFRTSQRSGNHVAHVNIRSLLPSIDEMFLFLIEEKVDLMAISETWLCSDVSDAEICRNYNYTVIRSDRDRRGGGVALLMARLII